MPARDKYAEAEHFYQHSLEIREKALGREHPALVLIRANLVGLLEKKNGK
ncbi:MAG: tetratricopeptide repeat protein [Syntrophobacteraceae bacterium]